jgi:hypothetical protein
VLDCVHTVPLTVTGAVAQKMKCVLILLVGYHKNVFFLGSVLLCKN